MRAAPSALPPRTMVGEAGRGTVWWCPAWSPRADASRDPDGTCSMPPTVTLHVSATTTLLVIEGEIDLAVRDQLTSKIARAVRLCGDCLQLDASGVTFIDCCGLRPIEVARQQLQRDGKELAVVAASDRFRRVSELAGYLALAGVRPRTVATVAG